VDAGDIIEHEVERHGCRMVLDLLLERSGQARKLDLDDLKMWLEAGRVFNPMLKGRDDLVQEIVVARGELPRVI